MKEKFILRATFFSTKKLFFSEKAKPRCLFIQGSRSSPLGNKQETSSERLMTPSFSNPERTFDSLLIKFSFRSAWKRSPRWTKLIFHLGSLRALRETSWGAFVSGGSKIASAILFSLQPSPVAIFTSKSFRYLRLSVNSSRKVSITCWWRIFTAIHVIWQKQSIEDVEI